MVHTFIAAQIRQVRITGVHAEHHGGVTIGTDLLQAADIQPYEQVHITNLATGERWVTHALPGEPGQFVLQADSARLGRPGDACDVVTYARARTFPGAYVLLCHDENVFTVATYAAHGTEGQRPGTLVYDQEREDQR